MKTIRIMTMLIALMLSIASQAQNNCDSVPLPYLENFNSYTNNWNGTSPQMSYPNDPMPSCWSFLNRSSNRNTYPLAYLGTWQSVSGNGLVLLTRNTSDPIYAIMPYFGVQNENWILSFTYSAFRNVQYNNWVFNIGFMSDITDSSTFVSLYALDYVTDTTFFEVIIPAGTIPAGSRLAFFLKDTSAAYTQYNRATIDNLSLNTCSCFKVNNLAVIDEFTTDSSLTLTWTDTLNSGANYSVYDMSDNSLIQSGITDTFFTITGLVPDNEYTFAVRAECDSNDLSDISTTVSGRTVCSGMALPWSCGFEANEIYSTEPAMALPFCSFRYIFPANYSNPYYPYSRDVNSVPSVHSGNRCLHLATGSSPDTAALILPPVDITLYPMNGNQLILWARCMTAGAGNTVYVYTLNSPDFSSATFIGSFPVSNSTYTRYRVSLSNAPATDQYVAIMGKRGSNIFIDDLVLDVEPDCYEVLNVNALVSTENSITVSWTSNSDNSSATYSIYNMSDTTLIVSGLTDTSYTITGLISNTEYFFGIEANCPAGNAAIRTVSGRTACTPSDCGVVALPLIEDFESSSATVGCWTNEGPGNWSIGVGDYYPGDRMSYSGNLNARINHTLKGNATKFISPVLSEGDHGVELQFAHMQIMWGWEIDTLRVLYRSGANSVWHQVAEYYTSCNWTIENVSINDNVYQIAFEMVDGYGYGVALDSVVIHYNPNYPRVTSIAVDNTTDSTITISWTGNASNYLIYNGDSLTANVSNTSYTFTGLTPATQYSFGVEALIDTLKSPMLSITTMTDSIVPDSAWLTIIVDDSLMGITAPLPGIYHLMVEDSIIITAIPFEGYDFSVWSTGDSSAVINITIFTDTTITAFFVPRLSIDKVETSSVTIMPNPANDNVSVRSQEPIKAIACYDMNGRQLLLDHPDNLEFSFNVSRWNSGTYIVKTILESGIHVFKLIVKR